MGFMLLAKVQNTFIGIISLIGNKMFRARQDAGQQGVAAVQIMRLASRQMEARGVAERVTGGVDFGAWPPFGFADTFVFFDPPFAPAAC